MGVPVDGVPVVGLVVVGLALGLPDVTVGVAVVEQAESVSAESIAHASAKTEEYEQGSQLRL